MDFISNKNKQIRSMLEAIGVQDVMQLFDDIPASLVCDRPSEDGMSEMEGMREMERIGSANRFAALESYLGAGSYEHHVPAMVGPICQKSEFLTAYTPYQAEVSQGLLQVIFEFQSAICALTGMDVANASVYDGASACAEAVLMAMRTQKKRHRVLISEGLHPHYRAVVDQYVDSLAQRGEVQLVTVPATGDQLLDIQQLQALLDDDTVAVLVQSPNFLGLQESMRQIADLSHEAGALLIACGNPMAYGLYDNPGEVGADIAVGDTQPFGLPLQFGGPYVGYMACKQPLVRQLPGRIVGETTDQAGNQGFVLTLQAREQHIRREKATSNICSNQNLAALASLVTILWYGPEGLKKLAATNYRRSYYLKERLLQIPGVEPYGKGEHFNEFAVKLSQPVDTVVAAFEKAGIAPGLNLSAVGLPEGLLIAVTETKSQKQLDRYLDVAREVLK